MTCDYLALAARRGCIRSGLRRGCGKAGGQCEAYFVSDRLFYSFARRVAIVEDFDKIN